jgi:hypothetical protein
VVFSWLGPSGSNKDYILQLEKSLLEKGEEFVDDDTSGVCEALRKLEG